MITAHEVRHALTGAVLLARGNRAGAQHFEDTPGEFWRSFWSAVFVAPVWLVLMALTAPDSEASALRLVAAEAVEYALLWIAFPLVLHEILSRSGSDEHFCRYIAAHNWGAMIVVPAMLVAVVLALAVPSNVAGVLPLMVIGSAVAYEWFMARAVLEVSAAIAAGIAAMDFFLGQTIHLVMEALLAAAPAIDAGIAS